MTTIRIRVENMKKVFNDIILCDDGTMKYVHEHFSHVDRHDDTTFVFAEVPEDALVLSNEYHYTILPGYKSYQTVMKDCLTLIEKGLGK